MRHLRETGHEVMLGASMKPGIRLNGFGMMAEPSGKVPSNNRSGVMSSAKRTLISPLGIRVQHQWYAKGRQQQPGAYDHPGVLPMPGRKRKHHVTRRPGAREYLGQARTVVAQILTVASSSATRAPPSRS